MLRRTSTLLFCLVFLSSGLFAEPHKYVLGERSPTGSAFRSLVLPGWGQYYNGQKLKGRVIGGAVLLTLAGSYLLYNRANDTYGDYQDVGIKNGSLYDDYQAQSNQAMVVSIFCAGLWIWGVIDAYVYADEPAAEAGANTGLRLACGRDRAGLFYTKKF